MNNSNQHYEDKNSQTTANINQNVSLDSGIKESDTTLKNNSSSKGNSNKFQKKKGKSKKSDRFNPKTYQSEKMTKKTGNHFKRQDQSDLKDFRGYEVSNAQDPFWYAEDANSIQNMANFPWLEVVGDEISNHKMSIPGVLRVDYKQCIGTTTGSTGNYQNRAALAFYNYQTQGYTSSVPYQSSDSLFAVLAGASLMSLMAKGARALGCLNYYLQYNKYWAKDIVTALGFDFDSLRSAKANFITEFNIRVEEINKIVQVPKGFSIFDSWIYHESYLFTDTVSPEYSSIIAYNCTHYLKYDATTLTTGTCLMWEQFPDNCTVDEFFDMVDNLLSALNDDDVRQIFGGITRVYSADSLIKLKTIDIGIITPVVKNDIVNAKIHNLKWLSQTEAMGLVPPQYSADSDTEYYNIPAYQVNNVITATLCYHLDLANVAYRPDRGDEFNNILLDMYDHQVNPANVLDITDAMNVYPNETVVSSTADTYYLIKCRALCFTNVILFYYDTDGSFAKEEVLPRMGAFSEASLLRYARLSKIDSHPLITIQVTDGGVVGGIMGEVDRYNILSSDTLSKLHDRTFYKLLSMPSNNRNLTK